jgi:hypothetical protein
VNLVGARQTLGVGDPVVEWATGRLSEEFQQNHGGRFRAGDNIPSVLSKYISAIESVSHLSPIE